MMVHQGCDPFRSSFTVSQELRHVGVSSLQVVVVVCVVVCVDVVGVGGVCVCARGAVCLCKVCAIRSCVRARR